MKKIACITGTRPQLIKHAVLWNELQRHFLVDSIYTGQHYDYELNGLLKEELFGAHQFHELQIKNAVSAAERLGEMIGTLSLYLHAANADAVLVYGDTDTTLAGALVANKLGLTLIHIEAGERSFNRSMPEEHNRILTDNLADIGFCTSTKAIQNLERESIKSTIHYCGDLMKDLLLQTAQLFQKPMLTEPYIFCTIHRNYTKQNAPKLSQLLQALAATNRTVIFPVHPATAGTIQNVLKEEQSFKNIQFLPPVSYKESIQYQKFAEAVVTDSGGIQKEAYWLQRRCISVRKETEWTETLQGNWNQLVYNDLEILPQLLHTPLGKHEPELYGSGTAAACIAQHLNQLI